LKTDARAESDIFPEISRIFINPAGSGANCPRIAASTAAAPAGQGRGMTIFTSPRPLQWGELDVPLLGIAKDWHGAPVEPAAGFSLATDDRRLWFIAHHRAAARLHPQARPGIFQAELWKHDVAELFIADPVSGRYFEFNLAPNGAWWSCEFTAPRVRAEECDIAMPEIATFADMAADGAWVAAMAIPLDLLKARLDFGPQSRANVAFVLGSPNQRFLTAADLGGATPDFHQPERFPQMAFQALPESGQ
jgi:hypothetical protein